jgi:ribosome modulation factor
VPPVTGERRPSAHDPHGEGVRARVAGADRGDCPYAPACPEAAAWLRGWDAEEERVPPPL